MEKRNKIGTHDVHDTHANEVIACCVVKRCQVAPRVMCAAAMVSPPFSVDYSGLSQVANNPWKSWLHCNFIYLCVCLAFWWTGVPFIERQLIRGSCGCFSSVTTQQCVLIRPSANRWQSFRWQEKSWLSLTRFPVVVVQSEKKRKKENLTIIETTVLDSRHYRAVLIVWNGGLGSTGTRLVCECLTGQLPGSESSDMMEEFPFLSLFCCFLEYSISRNTPDSSLCRFLYILLFMDSHIAV